MSDLRLLLISGVKHASSRLEWDLLAHAACLQLSAIPQQQAVIRIKDQCFKRFGFPSISAENQQNSIFPLGEKYAVSNAGRRLPPSRCYRRETDGRTHVTCTSPLSALDSAHTCRTAHLDGLVPSLKPQNEKHKSGERRLARQPFRNKDSSPLGVESTFCPTGINRPFPFYDSKNISSYCPLIQDYISA